MAQELSVVETVNAVINRELTKETAGALLATTFKGLDVPKMKQALMEGMIRGFTFQDFLKKRIYAVPFGNGYSLVTSIDDARTIGMKSGVVGKSAPLYTYKDELKTVIDECTVTIKKLTSGHIGDFVATVSFDEYNTKRNLWLTKPKTMIAKVAEMHALRMACPEELSQQYIEEEIREDSPSRIKTASVLVDDSKLNMGEFKNENKEAGSKEDQVEGSDNKEHQTDGGGQG